MRKIKAKPLHLAKLNVHKGDTVKIIAGKDRGQRGRVERTFPRRELVLIEGHNIAKRHVKPTGGRPGGIIEKAMPIHVSNVMVICTNCNEPTRIGHDRAPQGTDQKLRTRRICKKCGEAIEEHAYTAKE
jgi:large subunit ribosomal protein L24